MSTTSNSFHQERKSIERPIWRESLAGLDWIALRASPVYYGLGVPRGDRSAVVVIPGFLGTDFYLQELYYWLRRVNYKPYMSGIGRNAECLDILVGRLSQTIKKAVAETGGKVHLIGHSLGGVLARSVAARLPGDIASIITLGSPFRGIRSHPLVIQTADMVRARILREQKGAQPGCYTGYCDCAAVTALQEPFPSSIKQSSIYTRTDGIVDWRVCVNEDPETNFEVKGTHVGLAFNSAVYELIATRLARK